jgi:hypothetical protein
MEGLAELHAHLGGSVASDIELSELCHRLLEARSALRVLLDEDIDELSRDLVAVVVFAERLQCDDRRAWLAALVDAGPAKPSTITSRSLRLDMIGSQASR